jgi:hypothetical protein
MMEELTTMTVNFEEVPVSRESSWKWFIAESVMIFLQGPEVCIASLQ